MRRAAGDVDRDVAAEGDGTRGVKVHDPMLGTASGELPVAVPARALDEDLRALADARAVRVERERALQVLDALEARLYPGVVELSEPVALCGRARPLGVLERVAVREADLLHQAQRVLEVRLGLARIADDQIRGDRDPGPARTQAGDDVEVGLAVVAPAHGRENARRSALHGQVQVRTQRRYLCEGADQLRRHEARVRA